MDAAEINATIDGNPGSNFDLVRIKGDVDENTARLIAEAGFDLPGVQVAVEARRDYTYGSLFSQILGYTGPVSADQLAQLKAQGYLPDDLARQDRVSRRSTRPSCAGPTAARTWSVMPRGGARRSSRRSASRSPATRST